MASQSSQRDLSESELRQLYDNEEAERFLHIFSTVSKLDIIKIVLFAKGRSTSQKSGPPATQSGQTEKTLKYPSKAMIPTGRKAMVRRVLLPYYLCQKRWLWYDGLEASPLSNDHFLECHSPLASSGNKPTTRFYLLTSPPHCAKTIYGSRTDIQAFRS